MKHPGKKLFEKLLRALSAVLRGARNAHVYRIHSASCVPRALHPGLLATFFKTASKTLAALSISTPAFAVGPGVSGMAGMVFSLLLILGLFVLAAWLAKRYLPQVGKPGPVKVIGSTLLSAREKVVVVEIEDTWLVLGVGGGQVHTLHTLPKPKHANTES